MQTLSIQKENIPNYTYKQNLYDPAKAVRKKNGFDSTGTAATKTNQTMLCADVRKNEYDYGKSPSKVSFGGLSSNKLFKTLLEKSADNGALCSASAMLLACGVLRPATIMASPNVELENRKIASAKSIASGLIGFGLMFLVSKPIEHAVKKINKEPKKYLGEEAFQKLIGDSPVEKAKAYNLATRFFKMSADMIVAAPKGTLTILLIPPLLNVLFKNKQKNQKSQQFPNQKNYAFFKGSNSQQKSAAISFKGNPYDSAIEKLAKVFGKIMQSEKVQNLAEKLKNTPIENHVMAASGTIVSSFYVINTVNSKKIPEERKSPLIYNSIISWALSTAGGYTIDKLLNKSINKFQDHYKQVNKDDKNLDKQLRGIKIVKSALIFGMMYRWITPWISTMLAEKVWNKKLQKNDTKKA